MKLIKFLSDKGMIHIKESSHEISYYYFYNDGNLENILTIPNNMKI
jgi:hypothetical protein